MHKTHASEATGWELSSVVATLKTRTTDQASYDSLRCTHALVLSKAGRPSTCAYSVMYTLSPRHCPRLVRASRTIAAAGASCHSICFMGESFGEVQEEQQRVAVNPRICS